MPMSEYSARLTWNSAAKSITVIKPIAAQTLNLGLSLSKEGSNNPKPPRSSLTPMKRTNAMGVALAQGITSISASAGWVAFIIPAIVNMAPSII